MDASRSPPPKGSLRAASSCNHGSRIPPFFRMSTPLPRAVIRSLCHCNRSTARGILAPLRRRTLHTRSTMKAIIPLAGKGTRLRPHTHHTPKPLLKVGGRPVMSYILDDLKDLGIEEVVFITGYLGDVI